MTTVRKFSAECDIAVSNELQSHIQGPAFFPCEFMSYQFQILWTLVLELYPQGLLKTAVWLDM